jgi:hypothetical protein
MNRLYKIFLFGFALLLTGISCGPTATFDTPQPHGTKKESAIHKKYFGSFLSVDSTSTLLISKDMIINRYESTTVTPRASLNSTFILAGDTLLNLTDNTKKLVQVTDSSIIEHEILFDTIFRIGENNSLRKFKGHYFLNTKDENSQKWSVTKLSLHRKTLLLSYIFGKEDIKLLDNLMDIESDTSAKSVNYDLDKKQFNEFLKSDGFNHMYRFTRISK